MLHPMIFWSCRYRIWAGHDRCFQISRQESRGRSSWIGGSFGLICLCISMHSTLWCWKHHGNIILRRSVGWRGITWSEANDSSCGLLREGGYHTAPMPMVVWHGRLCRAPSQMPDPLPRSGNQILRHGDLSSVDANLFGSRKLDNHQLPVLRLNLP